VANVFTAVFVSRTLFEIALRQASGVKRPNLVPARAFLSGTHLKFSRWGRHAALASTLVIATGAAAIAIRGLPLGIDFSGGTVAVVEFATATVTEADLRRAAAPLPGDEIVQRYGPPAERRFLIRVPLAGDQSGGDALENGLTRLTGALTSAGVPAFEIVERELVSAAIGADLQRRGVYATIASLAAISAYIAVRFRPSFAAGAIAATVHDVLVTVGFLAIAGYDLSLNVTAALLTIVGYSVNDTIVIFDRVRENAQTMRGQPLSAIVDVSVNQTLSRTVITAGATLLSVLALYVFGGEALRGFAFTMLVGIVSGTYSTVFIASSIAAVLRTNGRR
jgi:preprotein translocase SecF subunit